jgi:hypothetical protein
MLFKLFFIAAAITPAFNAAELSFDFTNNAQGWSGMHVAAGGNPGGYISAHQSFNVEPGPYFGAFTPNVRYVNVTAGALRYGSVVSFDWRYDIETQGTVSAAPGTLFVDLIGPSGFLFPGFYHGGAPNTWTQTKFLLTDLTTPFSPFSAGGQVGYLSESAFREFLPTVTQVVLFSNTTYQPGEAGGFVSARFDLDNFQIVATPEPGSWALSLLGLAVLPIRAMTKRLPRLFTRRAAAQANSNN